MRNVAQKEETVMESKQERVKSMRGMGLVLVMLVGLGVSAGSAQALIPVDPAGGCPKTLSTPGEYVLTGDLTCSGAVNGVIITASGVSFHLAGHTISNATTCADLFNLESVGIFVQGGLSRVRIDGGTVSGFNDGILLSSSDSRVRGMTVTNACFFGILVQGTKNQVDTNVVTANKNDGIALVPASNAVITSNDTSGNMRAGISLSAFAANNTITNNMSNNNGGGGEGYGIAIFNGAKNFIQNNVANNNDNSGIRISSTANTVTDNTVNGNADFGIWVLAAGTSSKVSNNTVLGSGDIDMVDESVGCDANKWGNNTFETDLVASVSDGGPGTGCIQ